MDRHIRQGVPRSRPGAPGEVRPSKPARRYPFEILQTVQPPVKAVRALVSRAKLQHNASVLKACCGEGVKLCAMVKSDGYGHDARSVVSSINNSDIDSYAVSTLEEASEIYPFVQGKTILVASPVYAGMDPEGVKLAQVRRFHLTVCSQAALEYVVAQTDGALPQLSLHLKVDSGMGRCGAAPEEACVLAVAVRQSDVCRLAGTYTHFATADEEDLSFVARQFEDFSGFLEQSGLGRDDQVVKHACNTAATLRFPSAHLDMVRCGLGLYGYLNDTAVRRFDLRPALRIEAPLVQIKTIRAGQSCGYGRAFVAPRDMRVGIVPLGYSDGLFRVLSDQACVRVGRKAAPIIGKISMDLTVIDVSHVKDPREGDLVTIIDDELDSPCSAQALAALAGTIPYEIFTSIGKRVKRVFID